MFTHETRRSLCKFYLLVNCSPKLRAFVQMLRQSAARLLFKELHFPERGTFWSAQIIGRKLVGRIESQIFSGWALNHSQMFISVYKIFTFKHCLDSPYATKTRAFHSGHGLLFGDEKLVLNTSELEIYQRTWFGVTQSFSYHILWIYSSLKALKVAEEKTQLKKSNFKLSQTSKSHLEWLPMYDLAGNKTSI